MYEKIIEIMPLAVLIITQVILIISGHTQSAKALEKKKQKELNKLIKKHNKTEQKFIKEEEKLKEIKENVNNTQGK